MSPVKPKIFLSYARGDDEAFVRRLYEDLTARGFAVWYDRVSMPSRGLTFHHEIANAVDACDRLLLVIGPRALASSYVTQEWRWAFAMGKCVNPIVRLDGSQPDQPRPPVKQIVPKPVGFMDAQDFRIDAEYSQRFATLVRQLSDPLPPLGKLIAVPELPDHYRDEPDRIDAIRDALLADLQGPVVVTGAAAKVGFHGMAGIGKSVLAAALARDYRIRYAFPDGVVWVKLGQKPDIVSLQRELAQQLGDPGIFESRHAGREKLRELLEKRQSLLIIDDAWSGLDAEAFDILGPRCKMLLTSRDASLVTHFAKRGNEFQLQLPTIDDSLAILAKAAGLEVEELPGEARDVVVECGRLPLALALCGGMVRDATPWAFVLSELRSRQLRYIANDHFREEQHANIWVALDLSIRILDESAQQRFSELACLLGTGTLPERAIFTLWSHTGGLSEHESIRLLLQLRNRSIITINGAIGAGAAVGLHDLLADFAMIVSEQRVGAADVRHKTVVDAYRKTASRGWSSVPDDGYVFQHLPEHLAGAGLARELVDLVLDLSWLEAKNGAGLAFALAPDFDLAFKIASPVEPRRRHLPLLAEAIRRDVHFIFVRAKDYPQGLFQCLWNTCWWYDCPDAAKHYDPPKGGWGESGAPWDGQSPRLCELLERWRQVREHIRGEVPWVRSMRPPATPLGGNQRAVLRGHEGGVRSAVFNREGTRVVTASLDKTARVWDAQSGQEIAVLRGHESWVWSASFNREGTRVVTASDDKTARVWDSQSGQEIAVLRGHEDEVTSAAFNREGTRIVTASLDNTARVWDSQSGQEIAVLRGHEDLVWSAVFNREGTRIVTASWDNTARVWDAASGRELAVLRGHERRVNSAAFSPDGTRVVTASSDETARVWDARSGQEIAVLRGHKNGVESAAFNREGTRVVTASLDKTARVWDAQSGQEIAVLRGREDGVTSAAFNREGTRVVTASLDKTARVWDAQSGQEIAVLRGHESWVWSASFNSEGTRVVTASDDKTARVWDSQSGQEIAVLRGHEDGVTSAAFNREGTRVVTASDDKTARVWDSQSGQEIAVLRGHEGGVRSAVFNREGTQVVTASYDNTARVWDARSGQEIAVLRGHKNGVLSAEFNREGTQVVTASYDNTARVWDAASGRELAVLRGHERPVVSAAFSPDGTQVVTASADETARVWDAQGGQEIAVLRGHEGGVESAAFNREGTRVVTASWDKTARVWDAASGNCLEIIRGHTDIHALAQGKERFPWRAVPDSLSTRIESAATGAFVAWYAASFDRIATHPSGRIWAGVAGSDLHLITLEGTPPSGSRTTRPNPRPIT